MTIAREEIFGPVISIIGFKDDEDAMHCHSIRLMGWP